MARSPQAGHGRRGPGAAGQACEDVWTESGTTFTLDCMVSQLQYPAAPVDPAALAQSLRPFGHEHYAPPRCLRRPGGVRLGAAALLRRAAGSASGSPVVLPQPGDQRAEQAGPGSVLLTRDDDGVLHAFGNSCRHRGHELLGVGESVQRNTVICPYHSWTYGLDGGLRFASGFRRRRGLRPVRLGPGGATRGRVARPDLRRRLGRPGRPARRGVRRAGRADRARTSPSAWSSAGGTATTPRPNWKILTENYHECYHCPMIHPELCAVSPPKSGENYQARRRLGGRLDGPAGRHGHHVAGRDQPAASRCAAWTPRACAP